MTGHDFTVCSERHGQHAVVTFERPPSNYMTVPLLDALAGTLEELAGTGWCRAAVLRSAGRHFCAGADLTTSPHDGAGRHVYDAGLRLFRQPLPLVAAIQGAAIGGGLGLAMVADFRVATPASKFVANFTRLGFHPGFGLTVTLPAVLGQQAAARLMLTGGTMSGEQAAAAGLCDELAADDDLLAVAAGVAAEIADAAPLGTRATRATLRAPLVERVEQAMARERSEQERLVRTADFREGVRAARERRAPLFSGA